MCDRVGRQTEAGRQRWHRAGSRQRGTTRPEEGTRSDGDSGDVAESNRRQHDPRPGLLLEPLLLLHCSPATTHVFSKTPNQKHS